jgi:hypothetical protein
VKIGVLIPTYNREVLLLESLASIQKQTHSDLDIIIWDDGSTDRTETLIKSLEDSRIRYFKGKHKGVSYARSALLKLSKENEFSCWQDSDDISNIYRIEEQLKVLQTRENVCVSSCHSRLFSYSLRESRERPKLVFGDRGRSMGSMMFRSSEAVPFISGVDYGGEDVEWVKDMKKSGVLFINVPFRLYYIRLSNRDRIGLKKLKFPEKRKVSNECRKRRET